MFRRILVATDGSATAARAVDRAVDVAGWSGATLTVLSAGAEADARRAVDGEAARLAAGGLAVDTLVVEGDPASAIVRTAAEGGFDLVVVGNKGMSGPRSTVTLGSVPNKVSHSVASSLLIVHTT